jgi:hypothetical protein
MYVCEEQKLRDMLLDSDGNRIGDGALLVCLDRLGMRMFQYDLGPHNEILLRLSYEFLKQLVEIQKSAPLEIAPVVGTARGRVGRVLA